jgi:hypothetical protein
MISDNTGRRAAILGTLLRPLAALSLLLTLPLLAACTTTEGTNAFATPATFEREVMTSTLQGLDIVPQEEKKPDNTRRAPLVLPKNTAQLPAPGTSIATAALPADSDNPTINTAGLTQADMDHLRNARVVDLNSLAGRPLTDVERRQLTARMQAANIHVSEAGTRPLTLPPVSYFSNYKGKDSICLAKDGTLVALNDPKCPAEVKAAMRKDGPVGQDINGAIEQQQYNMKHGITN